MRTFKMLLSIVIITILVTGCGTKDNSGNSVNPGDGDVSAKIKPTDINTETEGVQFKAEIIQNKDGLLVAPDKASNEYKSSDKMTVHLINTVITNQNGETISKDDFKVGDRITITYNGMIEESYPAQIGASKIEVIGHNNIIDAYLAMIDDIYQEDTGLNGDIKMIAFDTSGWIELEPYEKQMLFDLLKEKYGYEIKEGTFDELRAQGFIDQDILSFKEGILITIADMRCNEAKDEITYSIRKWRGGDGAIGSDKTTAKWNGTEWKITKEGMWIS